MSPDLAHAFINFLHDPAVAAENTECHLVSLPEQGLLSRCCRPRSANNPGIFMAPEIRAKSEIIADIGAANALYVKVWDRLKSAR